MDTWDKPDASVIQDIKDFLDKLLKSDIPGNWTEQDQRDLEDDWYEGEVLPVPANPDMRDIPYIVRKKDIEELPDISDIEDN